MGHVPANSIKSPFRRSRRLSVTSFAFLWQLNPSEIGQSGLLNAKLSKLDL